jgi:hypothetical protein
VLRRTGRLGAAIEAGDVVVDEQAGLAARAGTPLELTATELRLLAYLVRQRGLLLSKHQLLTQVWGYDVTDPLFVEKVYDVIGLYLNPPEAAVVYCVDERSQVQALARSQPAFPMMPGMPEKRCVETSDQRRVEALEVLTGGHADSTGWMRFRR